jgi:CHAT domain-containing protein/Tfp pilus assembly protein PilF
MALIMCSCIFTQTAGKSQANAAPVQSEESAEEPRLKEQIDRLYQEGRIDEAIKIAERIRASRERALGPEHPAVAGWLSKLAWLYLERKDYATAESLYKRSLEGLERALGSEDDNVAIALYHLASFYTGRGDYARAEPLYRRSLAIREKLFGQEHIAVADSLNFMANMFMARGDYAQAEPLYKRALAIREKGLGPEHLGVADSLHNLAALYSVQGDYVQAEPLYQRSLAIREKALGPEDPSVAETLRNLADLYVDKGDLARAEPLYRRSLKLLEKALGPEHPALADVIDGLASCYGRRKDYLRAEPLYKRSLAIREKAFGPEDDGAAGAVHNLAGLYFALGDYARAEPLYRRFLEIIEKARGPTHPAAAGGLASLARLYTVRGEYARAEPLYQRSLEITERALGPRNLLVASLLGNLAELYEAEGNYEQAISYRTRANDIDERNIALTLTSGSEDQKRLYLETLSYQTNATVSLHVRSAPQAPEAVRLALTTILRRKGRSLEAFTSQLEALRRRTAPEDQKLLDQLAAVNSQLAALRLSGSGGLSPAAREAEAVRLEGEEERLEDAISRRSGGTYSAAQPVTLDAVRQALPADTALVEMFVYRPSNIKAAGAGTSYGTPRYVAYILRRSDIVPLWVELGEASTIEAEVGLLREALRDPQRADVRTLARAVDERVMRPIRKLVGPGQRLFLSPDGALNLIPFAALVDENGRYLVENYSITYLTSGRDLLRLQTPVGDRGTPVVVANPLYDIAAATQPNSTGDQTKPLVNQKDVNRGRVDFTLLNYKPLPGTAEEAAALTKLWPDAQVLTQDKATESALKQVHRPRLLHIATHGFFLPDETQTLPEGDTLPRGSFDTLGIPPPPARLENPLLRSGLLLAGVKQQLSGAGEDGVLTALEAASLDLWGTKLTVLSACETGLGDVRNGAGVYGLRRALFLAGSESQVMSLWKVSDAATRDLMTAYYTRLHKGEGRAEALRQVQLDMLRSQKPSAVGDRKRETSDTGGAAVAKDYRHPYYWASFIQSGDWRNLAGDQK